MLIIFIGLSLDGLSRGKNYAYACFDRKCVVGFITIQPKSFYLGESVYIINLNVAEQYRRKGIAAKWIRIACKQYDENKIIFLYVSKTNEASENLYQKLGFTEIDLTSKNGETDLVIAVLIQKVLA